MNRTYRYVFFSFAEMYVEACISNEPRLTKTDPRWLLVIIIDIQQEEK